MSNAVVVWEEIKNGQVIFYRADKIQYLFYETTYWGKFLKNPILRCLT